MDWCENTIRIELGRTQFRQELHDRYFHGDIYHLSKPDRLKHLVLHQCKYISQLYTIIHEYGTVSDNDVWSAKNDGDRRIHQNNLERMRILITDGFIVALSMMNVCNYRVESFIPLEDCTPIHLMVRHMGKMAKTIEDIDHMGQTNPLGEIISSVEVLLAVYHKQFEMTGGDLKELISRIYRRLVAVEEKNVFYKKYHHIMLEQLKDR